MSAVLNTRFINTGFIQWRYSVVLRIHFGILNSSQTLPITQLREKSYGRIFTHASWRPFATSVSREVFITDHRGIYDRQCIFVIAVRTADMWVFVRDGRRG
jgi:hypothetical protein